MPFYQHPRALPQRFRCVLSSFLNHDGLPFADVLPEETIEQTFAAAGCNFALDPNDVYTPPVTLWAFLSQVLFKDEQRSCLAAVARVIVLCVVLGKEPPSDNSAAYCRARAKIPVQVIQRLTDTVADGCEAKVPEAWLWKGRHVKLVDGTTVSMPDTAANQETYPQHTAQQPGVGFPIARMVLLLSLATAMVHTMAMGAYSGKETGETALLRQLLEQLQDGDIVLADRYYCSYFMIALFQELGIDFVARLHQARHADFRRGQRLGQGDHLVTWLRPQKPVWMDQETYDRMPACLQLREVQVQIHEPGFRVESLVVVTTLTDAASYHRDDLAELYHQRWLVELDIRAIKTTLGMDVLRCKTPAMVQKEIWTCLLAYNLIRKALLEAALLAGRSPRQLSFTAALQKIAASWATLTGCNDTTLVLLIEVHLRDTAGNIVGDRPGRVEPRAAKRRPKPHKLLNKPRAQARAELLAGAAEE